ncbi:hypothetical protein CH293_26360 [Rhodococcus sp. 14-2470-1b]|nr:hypothetical protein CH293_26360 [Rhodococcus sp. 14-2470-1b]
MLSLRLALRFDAVASGALGIFLLVLASVLDGPLGIRPGLSIGVGIGLLVWAAVVLWVSVELRSTAVLEVIVLNVVWIAVSIVFAWGAWGGLTGLGITFVLAQAGIVAVFTGLQISGRRTQPTPNTVGAQR